MPLYQIEVVISRSYGCRRVEIRVPTFLVSSDDAEGAVVRAQLVLLADRRDLADGRFEVSGTAVREGVPGDCLSFIYTPPEVKDS
jgi:hypothetical protein